MGVGDSLELFHRLSGPLPAGAYSVLVTGITAVADAKLHGDLLFRPAGTAINAAQLLISVDSVTPSGSELRLVPWINATACAPAVAAQDGDGLVLRLAYVSGSASFLYIETELTIP